MQPHGNSSRKNVTALAQRFTAGHVDVCRQGGEVALHFHTTEGLVMIRMEERDFVRDCRGPRDANGNPLRRFEDLDDATRHKVAEAQAVRAEEQQDRNGVSPEMAAKCDAVWKSYLADASLSQGAAADRAGLSRVSFNLWVRHTHPDEAREIRLARWGLHRRRKENAA